jgi:ligand-binding sensor domain-containing protein
MTLRRAGVFLGLGAAFLTAQLRTPDRTIQYRPGDWTTWPMMRVATSVDLDERMVYVATTGGIGRYDYYRNEWGAPITAADGLTGHAVRALGVDPNSGYLWAVTEAGVNARVPGSEEWRFLEYGPAGVSEIGIGEQFVWFRTGRGLTRMERTGNWTEAADEQASLQDHVLWKGGKARDIGLNPLFMDHPFLFIPPDVIQDAQFRRRTVAASVDDGFHSTWVATDGLGLGRADRRTFRLEMLAYGLFMPDVRAMAADGDGLWMGGLHPNEAEGGITYWDMARDEWRYFEARYTNGLRSDQVTSISADSDCVWFGTLEGLVRYDKKGDQWRAFNVQRNLWSNEIHILAPGDSVLWVGTAMGLNRVSLPDLIIAQVRDNRIDQRAVYDIKDDGESLWIAAERGAFRLNKEDGSIDALAGYPGLSSVEAWAVSVWEDEVWFATDDGVEMLKKSTGDWTGFSRRLYPTGGRLNAIAADSDVVWVGTEEGVLKYLKSENRWRRFTTADGLPHNSVRWIVPDGETVWFATGGGLTRFLWNTPYRID